MKVDYATLEVDIFNGVFRQQLEEELLVGFRQIRMSGERLPVPSHYAAQIAEIVNREGEIPEHLKYELYQEIVDACTNARERVLAEDVPS